MRPTPRINPDEAAKLVKDGDTLLVGGFGMTGTPVHLLHALARTDTKDLTYVGNNIGEPGLGGGQLLRNGQVRKAIGSYFTSNPEAVAAAQRGAIQFELLPQGSLAESLRAGGAGIGGFFTPTGADTSITEGHETRQFGGTTQVFVPGLRGNIAFLRAWKADTAGNLVYRMTEQNFNRVMATAASVVVAEVEQVVAVGELAPEEIHTPCCFVDYLVQGTMLEEHLGSSAAVDPHASDDDARVTIARRALAEFRPGEVINLGIGIPTLIANLITEEHGVVIHSENGMLGVGPSPKAGGAMSYPVNAGKYPVTALPGASYFDSSDSFAMIRGGHVDVAVMGALQVDEAGNLANWAIAGKPLLGVGGAMDLAAGAKRLIITMTHSDRHGNPKIVRACRLPLTALGVVDTVITEMAVFRYVEGRLVLAELLPGATVEQVIASTEAAFDVDLHPVRH